VETTTITYTESDGTKTSYVTNYWAWVGCDGPGSVGDIYDPTPSGGTVGPPAPPSAPAPPDTDPCTLCQDQCWAEYVLCMSDDQNTNWMGFCGIMCRESCRWARDLCTGGTCVDNGSC